MAVKVSKQQIVAELKEKLSQAHSVVIGDNKGLTVSQVTQLRRELREAGVEFRVAKNTLIALAAKEAGIEGLEPFLHGPTTLAFGLEDAVAPAKKLTEFFGKERQPKYEIKVGILDGKVIDKSEIKALADLPSREVLLGKVVGGMQAPMYGFAGVMAGLLRQFAYVVEARRQQLEEAGA